MTRKLIADILSDNKNKESAITRINKYTNKKSVEECWEWISTINDNGYAKISIGGRQGLYARTSRVVYYLYYGNYNEELIICHKCDNPSCVNPNHLFLGNHKDNTDDMYKKNRQSEPPVYKGEDHGNSKLTDQEVISIYNSSDTVKNIAIQYNICTLTVYRIKKGEGWKHLNLIPKTFAPFVPISIGKLSKEDVYFIRKSELPNTKLAEIFNYDASSIGKIKKGKLYKNI